MIRKFLGFGICGLLFLAVPQSSQAFLTTAQTATKINDHTLVFTISYQFGLKKSGLEMPIGAKRGLMFGDSSPYLGYTFYAKRDDDTAVPLTVGTTAGIVLSNATVSNNEYTLKKSEGRNFNLAVFVSLTDAELASLQADSEVYLEVTSLPFKMISQEGRKELKTNQKLNPSELQYYRTPTTLLNPSK